MNNESYTNCTRDVCTKILCTKKGKDVREAQYNNFVIIRFRVYINYRIYHYQQKIINYCSIARYITFDKK